MFKLRCVCTDVDPEDDIFGNRAGALEYDDEDVNGADLQMPARYAALT